MKIKKYIILFLIILTFGCTKKKDSPKVDVVKIPKFSKLKELNFSSFIDSSFTVALETKKECIIGTIDKIIIHNNHIFILDQRRSKGVFEFTMKGKFIRQYGKLGKGPGEYTSIRTFAINKKRNELVIYNWVKRALLSYNLQGEYLNAKTINFRFNNLAVYKGNYIMDLHNISNKGLKKESENNDFSLIKMGIKGKIKSKFLKQAQTLSNLLSSGNISVNEKEVFYNKPYSNIIYKLQDNNVTPYIKIDFEDKPIPEYMFENYTNLNSFKDELNKKDYAYMHNISNYYSIKGVLLFSACKSDEYKDFLYSLKTKTLYPIVKNIDYASERLSFSGRLLGSHDEFLISSIEPSFLCNENVSKNFNSENIKKFITTVSSNDNPILIFNKLKDHL